MIQRMQQVWEKEDAETYLWSWRMFRLFHMEDRISYYSSQRVQRTSQHCRVWPRTISDLEFWTEPRFRGSKRQVITVPHRENWEQLKNLRHLFVTQEQVTTKARAYNCQVRVTVCKTVASMHHSSVNEKNVATELQSTCYSSYNRDTSPSN